MLVGDRSSLSVLPLLGAWTLYRARKQGRPLLAPGMLAVIVAILVVSPWIARNCLNLPQGSFLSVVASGWNCTSGTTAIRSIGSTGIYIPTIATKNSTSMCSAARLLMDHKKEQAFAFIAKSSRMVCRDDDTPGALPVGPGYWSSRAWLSRRGTFRSINIFVATTITILAFTGLRVCFVAMPASLFGS